VRGVVSSAAGVLEHRHFDPFGNLFAGTMSQTDYGFTGEPFDVTTGLLYLRARHYKPSNGTFVSRDPLELLNLYSYVAGNPINIIDPTGFIGERPPTCSSLTNSSRCCGYDVTSWFLRELQIHADFARYNIAAVRDIPMIGFPPVIGPLIGDAVVDTLSIFAGFQFYGRAIPHKWMRFDVPNDPYPTPCPSGSQCSRGVTLCNKCIDRSELGNILYGWVGGKLALNQAVLFFGGAVIGGGLKGAAEKATAGIGIYLSAQSDATASTDILCQHIAASNGAFEDGSRWDWELANIDQNPDISQCTPCRVPLPIYFPHTRPSIDQAQAGQSIWADSSLGPSDPNAQPKPFYTTQIDVRFLAPELCGALSNRVWMCGSGSWLR